MLTLSIWHCMYNGWQWEVRLDGHIVDAGASYTQYGAEFDAKTSLSIFLND